MNQINSDNIQMVIDNLTLSEKWKICQELGYVPGNIGFYSFVFFLIAVILLVCLVQWRRIKARKWMNMPTEIASKGDFSKASVEIPRFLLLRAKMAGGDFKWYRNSVAKEWESSGRIYEDKKAVLEEGYRHLSFHTVMFLRQCHSLGCEVVIRQRGMTDIEVPENTDEKLEAIVARMNKERREDPPRVYNPKFGWKDYYSPFAFVSPW